MLPDRGFFAFTQTNDDLRFGSFSNTIYRNLALALSKLHINVDITVSFFVGQKNYRLHMGGADEHAEGAGGGNNFSRVDFRMRF